jgi:hypothetical protein
MSEECVIVSIDDMDNRAWQDGVIAQGEFVNVGFQSRSYS